MGAIVIGFSAFGTITIFGELTMLYTLYNIYCIIGTIITVGMAIVASSHKDDFVAHWHNIVR